MTGLAAGIVSAQRPGSVADRGTTVLTSFGLAIPTFWLALGDLPGAAQHVHEHRPGQAPGEGVLLAGME